MAFTPAISVSSSLGNSFTLKDGTKARFSMNGIQGKGVRKGVKSLEAHRRRWHFEWSSRCDSQTLTSTIIGDLNHTKEPTIHRKVHKLYRTSAVYKDAIEPNHSHGHWSAAALKKLIAVYKLSRPYTVIGSVEAMLVAAILPVESITDLSPLFVIGLLKALIPFMLMNFYAVALNQLYDVDIDKINKPSLPLASGELSIDEGIIISATLCIMSLYMGLKYGSPPIVCALLIRFVLGSVYSINLPLLRWKQYPFLAACCIIPVWGFLLQLPIFVHIQKYVLGRPVVLTKSIIFTTVFMCFFMTVITFLKDIPDIEGDKRAGLQSLSVRLGPKRMLQLGTNSLFAAYGIAMLVGAASANRYASLVLGHGLLASILWFRAQSVDIEDKNSTQSFYMFIWKLYYAEYFLIPFVR